MEPRQYQGRTIGGRSVDRNKKGFWNREHIKYRHTRWAILREMEVPTIAAVNGWAIGAGLDIAMACDIILASENAQFGYFYAKRGLVTDMGGAWDLSRVAGTYRACELIFTGDPWDANEARLMGIVSKVVPPDELIPTAVAMAERIAENDPRVVRMDKDLIYKAMQMDFHTWMDYMVGAQVVQDNDPDMIAWQGGGGRRYYERRRS